MNDSWKTTIRTIVFSILLGGAAGVLTSAWTNDYLSGYTTQLAELTEPLRVTEQVRPQALPASYEEALENLREHVLPTIGQATTATAISLTSDGWMLVPSTATQQEITFEDTVCTVTTQEVLLEHNASFVRCEGVGQSVVDFGSAFVVERGDQVFVLTQDELLVTHVQSVRTDDFDIREVGLSQWIDQAAVFTLSGEFIGVVDAQGTVLPLNVILPAFEGLLKTGELGERAQLPTGTIQATDELISLDGQRIGEQSLQELVLEYGPGDEIELVVLRAGEQVVMTVELE